MKNQTKMIDEIKDFLKQSVLKLKKINLQSTSKILRKCNIYN